MYRLKISALALVASIVITGCVTIAPPSPMMTYGGPEITPKESSEMAIGFGSAGVRFEGAHSPALGWFGRYKYGLSNRFDIGMDVMGATKNEGQYFGLKGAVRYQLTDYSRLELGFGGADDSDGKALNGDFAFTMGTRRTEPWNFYFSLRYGYAHGFAGNAAFADNSSVSQTDTLTPPNTHFALLNFGAQSRINDNIKFIIEGGYGYVFPGKTDPGSVLFVSFGTLFTVGR